MRGRRYATNFPCVIFDEAHEETQCMFTCVLSPQKCRGMQALNVLRRPGGYFSFDEYPGPGTGLLCIVYTLLWAYALKSRYLHDIRGTRLRVLSASQTMACTTLSFVPS